MGGGSVRAAEWAMDEIRNFVVGQADYLLFLHGLAFMVVASVSLALGRLDRAGLPWRTFALFAAAWGTTEWLEMIFIGIDTGPFLPAVQMSLALVAVIARAQFGRLGTASIGGGRLGSWILVVFGLVGVSGVFGGTQDLWITLDSAAALAAFWDIWVLARYRKMHHPSSTPLLAVLGGLGLYSLGTAIPVLHITWFLPGVAGGWPEGQLLWIFAAVLMGLGLMVHYRDLWKRRYPERSLLPPGLTPGRLTAAMFLILSAGWAAVLWGDRAVIREEKDALLHKAQMAAAALDGERLAQLEGIPGDSSKPAYASLKRKIQTVAEADPDLRFVYCLVLREGRFYFALDSERESSPDYSPPGMLYQEAPGSLVRASEESRPVVVGPFTDRWGTFISAFVPVGSPASSRVKTIVGVDVAYSVFRARVSRQRLVFILMTLLVALIQVGALTFRQMGRESVEALDAVEERYRHMFQDHSAVMLLVDPSSGRIVDCNRAACDFYGREKAELLDRSVFDLNALPPESVREALTQALHRRANRFHFQHFARGEGLRDVEVYSVPIRSGGEVFLFSIIHDITERKRAEEEKRKLMTQVLQTQKLESLGVLAGGIAHDFNNILQGILGNADLAMRSGKIPPDLHRHLVGIRKSSERAAELCKLMLAYSGKSPFSLGRLDLTELVRETVPMVEASVSKKVSLKFHFAEGVPLVEGDAAQVRQVIMNLLINAAESIGERTGTISTTVRPDGGPGCGDISGTSMGWVLLEVSDTGIGMDEATRDRIFDPFFTTKFAGRGLGLAAVQGIVRSHGGSVSVSSAPGEGTTFRVYLPAAGPASRAGENPALPQALPKFRGRVLLVDDEADIRDVAGGMLEHLGFEVATAEDGIGALGILGAGERFDAVLLDLTMPHLDGAETLDKIRANYPDLPVILVSGFDERELARRISGVGRTGFLHKPFSLDALSDTMASALGREA